ncbi:MAG TPA: hypothetical protein VGR87_06900 [Candidatus Limnocylindria bacterium]|jgi:hypothetical protein|nr:hypothetical protein [Candidatus Limnocylindria bacterium]
MTFIPEPDATPLRLRLGYRAENPPVEDVLLSIVPAVAPSDLDIAPHEDAETAIVETVRIEDVTGEPEAPRAPAWTGQLERAAAETDQRVDRWIADQQQRLVAGLDLMLAQLKERRKEEAARLEAWKDSERVRAQQELAHDEERFRARLMDELRAFEEQLALRLCEQEERLARWWDEAERVAERRFAELGHSADAKANT